MEVAANHVAQLVAPFALFAPQPAAAVAAAVMIVTQGWLVLSGNFAWLNLLTMITAFAAVGDGVVGYHHPPAGTPAGFGAVVLALTAAVAVLSYWPARNLLSRRQLMNTSFNPLHLVNAYGAFGSITRDRYEVVLEGTAEEVPRAGAAWREYEFRAKPGDPRRRPPQVAPYHLRLDWLMWFAALSGPGRHPWLTRLVERLLRGDPGALRLLRGNPFPDAPPRYVRARLYRYRFATAAERRRDRVWWVRELAGEYLPVSGLPATAGEPVGSSRAAQPPRPARP